MAARKRRGVCPACQRNIAVTWATGRVWPHGPADNPCPGVGEPPVGGED